MSKTMLKRVFAIMLALTMVLALVFTTACSNNDDDGKGKGDKNAGDQSFISSLGGVSETFTGAVSEQSFSSAQAAAEAYVEKEIAGESDADILSVDSKGTFEPDNVDTEIPSELLDGADSVEKLEVTYELESYSASGLASAPSNSKTVIVYVIKYGPNFKYFTPAPVTGQTISKSYYDSVFNSEKYENCTFEATLSAEAEMNMAQAGESMNMTMDISMHQLIKYENGKVYLEQTSNVTTKISYNGETQNNTDASTIYAYMEEVNGRVVCYVKQGENGSWMLGSLQTIGFSNLEELTPFHDQYLDYTYFTKTNYGFALEDENAQQYFNQAFADLTSSIGSMFDTEDMNVDMTAKYYVSDGVLSGLQSDAEVDMEMNIQGVSASLTETVNAVTTCTNYGTTVIERPNVD